MSNVNLQILVGRVGKDPEIRHLENGNSVANFSLATNDNYKDKQGNKVEQTDWHNCIAWGTLVQVIEKYVNKGDLLYIEGKTKTRSWEKDGEKRYTTEVLVNKLTMLGGNKSESKPSQDEDMSWMYK